MNKQQLGLIICKECDKEIGNVDSEKVETKYGVCDGCRQSK